MKISILILATLAMSPAFGVEAHDWINDPCTTSESWSFTGQWTKGLPTDAPTEIPALLNKPGDPVGLYVYAWVTQKTNRGAPTASLADYMMGRSLYSMQEIELAANYFNRILARNYSAETSPVQVAALGCMEIIRDKYPTISFTEDALKAMAPLLRLQSSDEKVSDIISEGLLQVFASDLKNGASKSRLQASLDALQHYPAHEQYALALQAMESKNPQSALPHLEYLNSQKDLPLAVARRQDEFRLYLGRLYYEKKDYAKAIITFDKIDKDSNQLASALSDLAWSMLKQHDYSRAVGVTVNLQSGGLARTFNPESLLVAAMALNELCQYAESLYIINNFKKKYKSSHDWIQANQGPGKTKPQLYPLLVGFLKGREVKVPELVAMEWLKSPVFQTRQEIINLLAENAREIPLLIKQINHRDQLETMQVRVVAMRAKEAERKLAQASPKGSDSPAAYQDPASDLKQAREHLRDFRLAVTDLKNKLRSYSRGIASQRAAYVAEIETELAKTNIDLDNELHKVFDNSELIEAEIWNGASQDLIWKNAHPDYADFTKNEVYAKTSNDTGGNFFSWHMDPDNFISTGEVWDDEIGTLEANLRDNCSNKEKYLKVKQRRKRAK